MIVACWSGPRNISTALMRSWSSRKDTYVTDEPFYAYYLKKTQINHPMHEKIINSYFSDYDEIVNHHVMQRIKQGCRECGSHSFSYEAGVQEENELKWYVILVDCGACGKAYEEIMEVRVIDEPNENDESE